MPIYEYRCDACGHHHEAMQSIKAASLTDCPNCGAPELKRLISSTSFVLKGGGWYVTDYKKPSAPSGPSAGSESASGAASTSSAGSSGGSSDSSASD